jgi:hypothetical protein
MNANGSMTRDHIIQTIYMQSSEGLLTARSPRSMTCMHFLNAGSSAQIHQREIVRPRIVVYVL